MKFEQLKTIIETIVGLNGHPAVTSKFLATAELARYLAQQERRIDALEKLASTTVAQPGLDLTEGRQDEPSTLKEKLVERQAKINQIALEEYTKAWPYDTIGSVRALIRKRIQEGDL